MSGPFITSTPPPLPQPTFLSELDKQLRFHGPSSASFPAEQPFVYNLPLSHPMAMRQGKLLPAEIGNRNADMWAQYNQKCWERCHVDGPSTRF